MLGFGSLVQTALVDVPGGGTPPVIAVETNTNFIATYTPVKINLIPQVNLLYWMEDFPAVKETNTSFIGTYTPVKVYINRSLYTVPDNQDGPVINQPETNVSFIGRFTSAKLTVLPGYRIFANPSVIVPPEAETNISFIGKYSQPVIRINPSLRFYSDQIQQFPETNVSFIAKYRPTKINVYRALFENIAKDLPPISPKYNFYVQLFG